MAEFSVNPTLNIVKAPKTDSDTDQYLLKQGRCPTCKVHTHERKGAMRKFKPITNEFVYNGRCLICNPIPEKEKESGGATSSIGSSSGGGGAGTQGHPVERPRPPALREDTFQPPLAPSQQQGMEKIERFEMGSDPMAYWHDRVPTKNPSSFVTPNAPSAYGLPSAKTSRPPAAANHTAAPPPAPFVPEQFRKPSNSGGQQTAQSTFEPMKAGRHYDRKSYPDGSVYEGAVNSSGEPHGKGIYLHDGVERYEGAYKNGQRHGPGKYYDLASGDRSEGTWVNGKMNGHGAFRFADGSEYVGNLVNGSWEGRGTYKSDVNDRYIGTFKNGDFEGDGTMRYHDGTVYTGVWMGGMRHGKGIFTSKDGEVDLCLWEYHVRNGQGVRFSADGQRAWEMRGQTRSDEITIAEARRIAKRVGLDVPDNVPSASAGGHIRHKTMQPPSSKTPYNDPRQTSSTSDLPDVNGGGGGRGGFKSDYLQRRAKQRAASLNADDAAASGIARRVNGGNGFGHKSSNGSGSGAVEFPFGSYKGDLNAGGEQHGQGTMTYHDGSTYTGQWRHGKRDGHGTRRLADGGSYVGGWRDDEMDGKGIVRYARGDSYEGEFRNSARNGRGVYRQPNGVVSLMCYQTDLPTGQGVRWSANGKQAYSLRDGRLDQKIGLDRAKEIADYLGLPVPDGVATSSSSDRGGGSPSTVSSATLTESRGRMASAGPVEVGLRSSSGSSSSTTTGYSFTGLRGIVEAVTGTGAASSESAAAAASGTTTKTYRNGTYEGRLNDRGDREGYGVMTYKSGAVYEGEWTNDKRDKGGKYKDSKGEIYVGAYKAGDKKGDGTVWKSGKVWRAKDGKKGQEISVDEARRILSALDLKEP